MTVEQMEAPAAAGDTDGDAKSASVAPWPARALSLVERFGLVGLLIAMVVFFALWGTTSEAFLSVANLRNVFASQAVVALLALAGLVPLVCGEFDVSIGAVLGVASVAIAAICTRTGLPLTVALAAGIGLAAAIGALSGFLVAYVRASSLVISLGVATLLGGLMSLYTNDQSIIGIPASLTSFGSENLLGVPWSVWLMGIVVVLVSVLLRATVTGRRLTLIGANPRSAELVGVPVRRVVLLSFLIGGTLAGLAGALYLAQTGAANPANGFNLTLAALAAVFLGSTTIRPGTFNVAGTIVGVFFVGVLVNGLTLAGAAAWVQPVFNGAAVIVAVSVSALLMHRRGG